MNKNLWIRALVVLVFASVLAMLIYYAFVQLVPDLLPLVQKRDTAGIQSFLRSRSQMKGILCTIALQILQIYVVVVTGVPIQIAAGAVYGGIKAFVICHIASVFGMVSSMMVWRRMGNTLEKYVPLSEKQQQMVDHLLDRKTPPFYLTMLACMVPICPNGIIPIVASKMKISLPRFALSMWLGLLINTFIWCVAGEQMIEGQWGTACALIAILVIGFPLILRNKAKLGKNIEKFHARMHP